VQLQARRDATVARGVRATLPVFVDRAGGGVIVDFDGNSFIDFGAGIAVVSVGNAAPHVVAGAQEHVARYTHTCFMLTPYEPYVAVCEELAALTPGTFAKRSALFNSGAEAVENAVKVARAYTGRQAVIAFDHAYHGRTNLTMALTAKNMPYKHSFGPFAGEIYRMPMAYPFRWPTGPQRCGEEAAAEVLRAIDAQVGASNVAAILIEPIQGEGGFIVPGAGFLLLLADYCREHGIVFIADEIQTGFCRTGDWFACDHDGVVPDLIATAKRQRALPADCRCRPSPAVRRSWIACTSVASAAPTVETRSPAPPGWGRSARCASRTFPPRPSGSPRSCCRGCTTCRSHIRSSEMFAAAARCSRSS
jgi:4-aminobutyrate aminotransferase / (S)-3-amino-2-methylpropionate transaminase / 5-aminovalerate transaminase